MRNRAFLPAVGIAVALAGIPIGFQALTLAIRPAEPGVSHADNALEAAAREIDIMVREVTAYNVGVRAQTSAFPCIGAMGVNLCELVDQGRKICAANFVALGTVLRIEEFGECVVLDRMNRRYADRVDIAMREDEIEEARTFGVRRLSVAVK